MGKEIRAEFAVKSWDEKTWEGVPSTGLTSPRRTHAIVTYTYTGAVAGESTIHYLMSYAGDGTVGSYAALEHVTAALDGRTGAFDLLHRGTFDASGVYGIAEVVPQSGRDGLAGLRGTGVINLGGHQETYPFVFTYEIE